MIYFFLTLISFFIFFLNQDNQFKAIPSIQENWAWSKIDEAGMQIDSRSKYDPLNKINGYRTKSRVFFFKGSKFNLEENNFSELPSTGKGHLVYKKIGSVVSYYSQDGEVLWEKPYKSYPRISNNGELILYLSGDGNQVLVSDGNGNPIGVEQVDGRFLADYSFPALKEGALLVFAGGEIVKLNANGTIAFKKEENIVNGDLIFAKSGAISPDSKFIAVHFLKNNKDHVNVYNEKGDLHFNTVLDTVYPHKLYMAVDDRGNLLVNTPDQILMKDKTHTIYSRKKGAKEDIYQIAFATGKFFIASEESQLIFLSQEGLILKKRNILMPARARASGDRDIAIVETPEEIISFKYFQ